MDGREQNHERDEGPAPSGAHRCDSRPLMRGVSNPWFAEAGVATTPGEMSSQTVKPAKEEALSTVGPTDSVAALRERMILRRAFGASARIRATPAPIVENVEKEPATPGKALGTVDLLTVDHRLLIVDLGSTADDGLSAWNNAEHDNISRRRKEVSTSMQPRDRRYQTEPRCDETLLHSPQTIT